MNPDTPSVTPAATTTAPASGQLPAASPSPASQQVDLSTINPFEFDSKVQQFQDFAKSKGAPQDQIDRLTGLFRSTYQSANGGSFGKSSGVLGTGFGAGAIDENLAAPGETPDAYRQKEIDNSGIIADSLKPGEDTITNSWKAIPNAFSDVANVATGVASMVENPIQTIKSIYNNPLMLAGPAAQNILEGVGNVTSDGLYGAYNVLGDLFHGNISQAGTDALAAAKTATIDAASSNSKAWTGLIDHPIMSLPILDIFGTLGEELGVKAPTNFQTDATAGKTLLDENGQPKPVTLKSDIASKTAAVKGALADPIAAARAAATNIASSVIAPFRTLMPKATGDAAATIIADRAGTALGQIVNLQKLNDSLSSRPDYEAQAEQAGQGIESSKAQSSVNEANANAELASQDMNKRVADQALESARTEDHELLKALHVTLATNTEDLAGSIVGASMDKIKSDYQGGYSNLKAKDGSPIPVTQVGGLADALQKFSDESGHMLDQKSKDVLEGRIRLLRVQDMAGKGMSDAETYKALTDGLTPNEARPVQEWLNEQPANLIREPMYAAQLKGIRNDIIGRAEKGAVDENKPAVLESFTRNTGPAFTDMVRSSVEPVNPGGAAEVFRSDEAFKNSLALREKYGIGKDGKPSLSKVKENFSDFQRDFPAAAAALSKSEAASLIRGNTTVTTSKVNYEGLADGLREDEYGNNIISPDNAAQIQRIITKSLSDTATHDKAVSLVSDNKAKIQAALDQSKAQAQLDQANLGKQAKAAAANAKVAPTDEGELFQKVNGIRTVADMKRISDSSGMQPGDLGNFWAAKSMLEHFGENPSKLPAAKVAAGIDGFLKDYDSLGKGSADGAKIKQQMLGDNGPKIESLRAESERMQQAIKEGSRSLADTTARAVLGTVVGTFHSLMGASMTAKVLTDFFKPRVTEEVPGMQTSGAAFRESGKKIEGPIAKGSIGASNVQRSQREGNPQP